VRAETALFDSSSHKRDESKRLRTERQIALHRQRVECQEAEVRVRHLKFDLAQRIVLLALVVALGIAIFVTTLSNPDELQIAVGGASGWAVIAAALYRWRPDPGTKWG
jgi:hypothetical protein